MLFSHRKPTLMRLAALLPAICSLALSGCRFSSGHYSATPASSVLQPVPLPDWNALEPAARTQLQAQQARLEEARAQAGRPAQELAEAYGETGRLYHAYHL